MHLKLELPSWAHHAMDQLPSFITSVEERMAAVLKFARLNTEHETGGPFAAGVFEKDSGKLIVIGVNRVMPSNCSSAHAEVMALSLAQQKLQTYDLGAPNMPDYQLVVNWRPCVMCYGALLWSGIRSLVIAGSGPELEEITGFDEGPTHPQWREELERRGIDVTDNILKDQAIEGYRYFKEKRSVVYNARSGSAV